METSHWLIISMCPYVIGPRNLQHVKFLLVPTICMDCEVTYQLGCTIMIDVFLRGCHVSLFDPNTCLFRVDFDFLAMFDLKFDCP
jgi:hypothetical protein